MSDRRPSIKPSSNRTADDVALALRQGWSFESSIHDQWTADNPSKGQCEPSSFVAWEYLGGSLVLGQVFIDDKFSEHHYWNRLDGGDVDFTSEQFNGNEDIREIAVLTSEEIEAKRHEMRPDFKARIDTLRSAVAPHLD